MNEKMIFERYYNGEKNFMTPRICNYHNKLFDDEYLVVEFSEGEGIFGDYLFGVSCLVHNKKTGETQKIELSKAFSTSKEGYDYIKSITADEFKNADRYGEIKKI